MRSAADAGSPLAYPLSWPAGWPRVQWRKAASFGPNWTVGRACEELLEQLARAPIRASRSSVVISTNVVLRVDGLPRSNQGQPGDPGAAVYFTLSRRPTVLACDKWNKVEHNLRALAAHVEAMRAMDRWGVGSLERAFEGYLALPAPGQTAGRSWWEVLGLDDPSSCRAHPITLDEAEAAFREEAKHWHPDLPTGDRARWNELLEARKQAREALTVPA